MDVPRTDASTRRSDLRAAATRAALDDFEGERPR